MVARCIFENGSVRCSGEELVVNLLEKGISQDNALPVLPKDGEVFLQAISRHFHNAYLFATPVQEEEVVNDFVVASPKLI